MEYKVDAEPFLEGLRDSLNQTGKKFNEIVSNIISEDPYCGHDFYIYITFKPKDRTMLAHKLLYQHTLMKPHPMPGSTLLRVDITKKEFKLIWTLPVAAVMDGFEKGMFSEPFVNQCIKDFKSGKLNPKPEEDPTDGEIKEILASLEKRKAAQKSLKIKKIS